MEAAGAKSSRKKMKFHRLMQPSTFFSQLCCARTQYGKIITKNCNNLWLAQLIMQIYILRAATFFITCAKLLGKVRESRSFIAGANLSAMCVMSRRGWGWRRSLWCATSRFVFSDQFVKWLRWAVRWKFTGVLDLFFISSQIILRTWLLRSIFYGKQKTLGTHFGPRPFMNMSRIADKQLVHITLQIN